MMTENEFQTVFEQGYQEGWGNGMGYGILLGCGLMGFLGLVILYFFR